MYQLAIPMIQVAQIIIDPPAPDLGPIYFPITLASIAIAVGAAGASVVGLWATYKIGFKLARKMINKMGGAI